MILILFYALTLISVFLAFVLAGFFFFSRRGYRKENRLLAALLTVFNLQIVYSFMTSSYAFQYFMEWHTTIYLLRQASFLAGPLIYFYINSFLNKNYIIRFYGLFHMVPFMVVILLLFLIYPVFDPFIIWATNLDLYITILILTHSFIYIVMSYISMKSMTVSPREFFRSIKIASHNTWLQMVLLVFVIVWMINLNSFGMYMMIQKPWWCAFTASIFALTAFIIFNGIMLVLMVKPDFYYVITKYKNHKIDQPEKNHCLRKLESYMETHKPYLDPDLTLEALADDLSVNPRTLSQLINETYQKNFKSYILEYRIKESMKILADSNHNKLTVLEILYQVGFNSKSAFNNQFKQYTNLTPQEFRLKYIPTQQAV